ncbi:MAG: hypothetical protein METHP_02163 [Methanoregula sp. SKADARSKE-2]|nr:MAG: hypothetical protein METHP_02163 [Methanoregula sp. SKADARSKE-2]
MKGNQEYLHAKGHFNDLFILRSCGNTKIGRAKRGRDMVAGRRGDEGVLMDYKFPFGPGHSSGSDVSNGILRSGSFSRTESWISSTR